MTVDKARARCLAIQSGDDDTPTGSSPTPVPFFGDFVANVWRSECFDRLKPPTQCSTNSVISRQLVPTFGDMRFDRIGRAAAQAYIIHLLYYTGCRCSEIRTLRWCEVRNGTLDLVDSKTGPRKVDLNSEAFRIVTRQPRAGSAHVFPSPSDPTVPIAGTMRLWFTLRNRASLEDVRPHDLRRSFASQAVLNGVPLPTVARFLGHRQVSMTLR